MKQRRGKQCEVLTTSHSSERSHSAKYSTLLKQQSSLHQPNSSFSLIARKLKGKCNLYFHVLWNPEVQFRIQKGSPIQIIIIIIILSPWLMESGGSIPYLEGNTYSNTDTIGGPPLICCQQNVGASSETTQDRTWIEDVETQTNEVHAYSMFTYKHVFFNNYCIS